MYGKEEEYERVSQNLYDNGVYHILLAGPVSLWSIQQVDVIKVIEFCSSVDDGMNLLFKNLDSILRNVNRSFVFN